MIYCSSDQILPFAHFELANLCYGYDELGRISQLTVAGVPQDTTTYDAIGRDSSDVTPLGQINTAYLGETDQVSTITALGQNISGAAGLTTYGYLANSGDRRRRANSAPSKSTITFNAASASNETITTDDADRVNCRTDGTSKIEAYAMARPDRHLAHSQRWRLIVGLTSCYFSLQ